MRTELDCGCVRCSKTRLSPSNSSCSENPAIRRIFSFLSLPQAAVVCMLHPCGSASCSERDGFQASSFTAIWGVDSLERFDGTLLIIQWRHAPRTQHHNRARGDGERSPSTSETRYVWLALALVDRTWFVSNFNTFKYNKIGISYIHNTFTAMKKLFWYHLNLWTSRISRHPISLYRNISTIPLYNAITDNGGCRTKFRRRENRQWRFFSVKEHPAVDEDKHWVGVNLSDNPHGDLVIIRVAW